MFFVGRATPSKSSLTTFPLRVRHYFLDVGPTSTLCGQQTLKCKIIVYASTLLTGKIIQTRLQARQTTYLVKFRNYMGISSGDVEQFNNGLEVQARNLLQSRKNSLLKQSNLLGSLGVPMQKSANVPMTFAVPTVQKKVIIKPSAPTEKFTPEPALDDATYQSILQVIDEMGKQMESHPSTYQDKDEESLRDLFLMVLSPHFDSVSGETFNKRGKTDILIRHEQQNVFVAECKVWKGIKEFFKAIDQLLSYLTWRDSKASLIFFVRAKELSTALTQVESETKNHPCYVKFKGKVGLSRFDFEFHLTEDPSRSVQVSVQCFHLA